MNKKLTLEQELIINPESGPKPRKISLEQYRRIQKEKISEEKRTEIPVVKKPKQRSGFRVNLLKERAFQKCSLQLETDQEKKQEILKKIQQLNEKLKDMKKLGKINKN